MPQMTIYLPEDLFQQVRTEARKSGKSLSAYMGDLARRATLPSRWPEGFFDLYGSCELPEPQDHDPEPVDSL